MAAGLESCSELFAAARGILDVDLAPMCTTADAATWPAELVQPALYITSVGAARALQARGLRPDAVLGHSLGEWAALTAAGALAFEDALRVVAIRGAAMAAAARNNPGGMAAVMGLDPRKVGEICSDVEGVWVANHNSPSQVVVSGADEALARAEARCRTAGAIRIVRLEVAVPAHCPLMEAAAREVEAALRKVNVEKPACAFYSAVDGARHEDPIRVSELLVDAITSPVRFVDTLVAMQEDGLAALVEVGPSRVLCGLARRCIPGVATLAAATQAEADAVALADPIARSPLIHS
jgi:[acyl-carrier-protein] S-malonyltransferase